MTFVVTERVFGAMRLRGRSMLRAGRVLTNRFFTVRCPTPQERADLYVSRLPIAVLAAPSSGPQAAPRPRP
jgi:hypothetical protein